MPSPTTHPFLMRLWIKQGLQRYSLKGNLSPRRRNFLTSHPVSYSSFSEDNRARLSKMWVPTGGIASSLSEDAHTKLVRAGFLRQAHSGIFHMLPLGRRVQNKLEALIDKYMQQLGASRLDLSSISSEEIWSRSGRLETVASELFQFKDRKDVKYLLSPTHEEEITALVSGTLRSYKQLPIRLYQISRKYRDEIRPRHGLLRSREFTMKDLYTFDYNPTLALATYYAVKEAYTRLFDELKLPYLVAEADSGDMGGNLSHEFHFPNPNGEDHIISCSECGYIANEEKAESVLPTSLINELNEVRPQTETQLSPSIQVWRGISVDRSILINAWYPSPSTVSLASSTTVSHEVNIRAIKAIVPELDASVNNPVRLWNSSDDSKSPPLPMRVVNLMDGRLPRGIIDKFRSGDLQLPIWPPSLSGYIMEVGLEIYTQDPATEKPLNLLRIKNGDNCPRCPNGTLNIQRAIELGHTFHLGTRYSAPLMATVELPNSITKDNEKGDDSSRSGKSHSSQQMPLQMGCHGIGVTRMIGAIADNLADKKGLNWPRVIAPYEVVIISKKGLEQAAIQIYDTLRFQGNKETGLDLVLDDRLQAMPWKMQDADLVGYPIIVILGRKWETDRVCEVQCRRLQIRKELSSENLFSFVNNLLYQL